MAEQVGLPASSVNYIAFSGGGAALAAVLGGQVSAAVSGFAEFAGQIAAGQLRILAVSAPSRVAGIDAPTLRESGIALDLANWRAIVAPPGLSDAEQAALTERITRWRRAPWRATLAEERLGRSVPRRPAVSAVPARRTIADRSRASAAERHQYRRGVVAAVTLTPNTLPSLVALIFVAALGADDRAHDPAAAGLRPPPACAWPWRSSSSLMCCRSCSSRWDSSRHRRCCLPHRDRPARTAAGARALVGSISRSARPSRSSCSSSSRAASACRCPVRRLLMGELLAGFAVALTPSNLLWGLAGTTLGTAVGVLPGIGPALTVALLLPITYGLDPTAALIMFAGIYYGAMYGGSTTSILLNTPGESATIVTAIDGHQMARNGRAGAALATAAIGSFVAGTLATFALSVTAPLMVKARARVWLRRVFRVDGAGVRDGHDHARRIAAARMAEPAARADARFRRHRRPERPGALHVRHSVSARRHRSGDRRDRPVRDWRDAVDREPRPGGRRSAAGAEARCG